MRYTEPAVFIIRVRGEVNRSWSDKLGGMTITNCGEKDAAESTLFGSLADQAALFGVLNTLFDNRFPLLYLRYLPRGVEVPAQRPGQGLGKRNST